MGFPFDDAYEVAKSMIDRDHYYVAYEEEKKSVLGFVVFGVHSLKTAHIIILAVHKDHFRKGVGSKLLDFTLATIKKTHHTKVRLEVRTTNEAAIEFYKKYGFTIQTTLKEYYDDNGDGYLMIKEIK